MYGGGQDITDLHIIINLQRTCHDVRPVQFFTDDAAADGIPVHTDQQIEESCPVEDKQFFICINGA